MRRTDASGTWESSWKEEIIDSRHQRLPEKEEKEQLTAGMIGREIYRVPYSTGATPAACSVF